MKLEMSEGKVGYWTQGDEGPVWTTLLTPEQLAEVKTTYGMDIDEVVSHKETELGVLIEFRDATQDADDDNMFLLIGPNGDVVDCGYE